MGKFWNSLLLLFFGIVFIALLFYAANLYNAKPETKEIILEDEFLTQEPTIILEDLGIKTNFSVYEYSLVDMDSILVILKGDTNILTIQIASKGTDLAGSYGVDGIPNRILEDIDAEVFYLIDDKDVIYLVDGQRDFTVSRMNEAISNEEVLSFLEGLRRI